MRQPIICGNWKMNKTIDESISLITALKTSVSGKREMEIVVCPPFISLNSVRISIQNTNLSLGAQNLCWEESGAYTGEVAAPMLVDCGCEYVIIGHSERRKYFSESNSLINKKIQVAIENELKPILCVGETEEEKKQGLTNDILETQVRECLKSYELSQIENLVLAYEPVWAIGTGNPAKPKDAENSHKFIREIVASIFGNTFADKLRILYGGSVTPENISDLMSQPNLDGALVGGASLDAKKFAKIIEYNKD